MIKRTAHADHLKLEWCAYVPFLRLIKQVRTLFLDGSRTVFRFALDNTHCWTQELDREDHSIVFDLVNGCHSFERGQSLVHIAFIDESEGQVNVSFRIVVHVADFGVCKQRALRVEDLREQDVDLN